MFGDLLKKLAMDKIGDISQDKLGFDASSLLGGLFGGGGFNQGGGSMFNSFIGDNPKLQPLGDLQNLFGEKWQNGQSDESQCNFQDLLEKFIRGN